MSLLITKENISDLKPGDLIEFAKREYGDWRVYFHWAVYKGDEEVVHVTGQNGGRMNSNVQHLLSVSGIKFNKARVKIENIWEAAGGRIIYRNNAFDDKLNPLPETEIVRRSLSNVGVFVYDLLTNNCEHFANWCRYGFAVSGQVETVVTWTVACLVGLGPVYAAVRLICWFRKRKEKKRKEQSE